MALSATTAWDVRTTGSDSNGGGFNVGATGTDYSQQNAAQVAFTDLVIGATATQLTSSANPFTSAHVGNIINITSGTGFTLGRFQVASVSGVIATMDRAVGTASSTGGNGNLGGSLATIQAANTASVAGNSIYIKSGTYTLTSTMAVAQITVNFIGYQTTHGDNGTKPLITTATNSTNLMSTSSNAGIQTWQNLSFSNTATTRAAGLIQLTAHGTTQRWVVLGCLFDGFTIGIDSNDSGSTFDVSNILITATEVKNCSSAGISTNTGILTMAGCYVHDCSGVLVNVNAAASAFAAYLCIFANCSGTPALNINPPSVIAVGCTFSNNSGIALSPSTSGVFFLICNNLFDTNGHGISFTASGVNTISSAQASGNNAFRSSPNSNWNGSPGDVTLTASPFTNSAAGDYSLNSTAGGGAACKGAGLPGVFPGGASTGHTDIGAVQSASGGGGSTGGSFTFLA